MISNIIGFFSGVLLLITGGSHTFGALTPTQPVQGGTGSTTLSGILIGNGTSPVNTLTIGTNLTLTGTTLSATGGGGGTFPFNADTNYGQVVYSTSTPTLWLKSGLFASSTSHFANFDFVNATGSSLVVSNPFLVANGTATSTVSETATSSFALGISGTYLNLTGASSATSTSANGLDLSGGCFSIGGTCLQSIISSASAYKQAVKYASTSTLPANTYSNGSGGVGATLTGTGNGPLFIDGNTTILGDRILVKNEATGANNGIYTVTTLGIAAVSPFVLTRATDYNSSLDVFPGVANFVNSGTVNANTCWILTNTSAVTIGTTALTYDDACGAGQYAGTWPIIISGTTFSFGGISTSSAIAAGANVLFATGVNTFASAATGTLSGSGGITVTAGTSIIGPNATVACASCSLFGYDWLPATNYAVNSNSTTTPLWLKGAVGGVYSFMASNTAAFDQIIVGSSTTSGQATSTFFGNLLTKGTASSTALIISNSPNGPLSTDSNGNVSASTTGLITSGTGISLDNSTRRAFGGGVAITNSGVISGSCSGGTTCSGTNPLSISSFNFPFTPGTINFGVNTNATGTIINFTAGIQASSTSRFSEISTISASSTLLTVTSSSTVGGILNAVGGANITSLNNLTSNGFVKTSGGAGALSIDTNTYLTGNQTVTLSGAVTGSGATAITTAFGTAAANTVLANGTGATAVPTFMPTSTIGLLGSSSISATSPIVYTQATGVFSCASCSLFGYDWLPSTNYAVNFNSTTTPVWFKGAIAGIYSLAASSTAAFDQIIVGSSTTSTLATSTIFGNLRIAGNASTTNMFVTTLASSSSLIVSGLNAAACDLKADTSGVISCGTDATGAGGAFSFLPATNYAVNSNSTTTPMWFKGAVAGIYSFMASNTAAFDQLVVGSSTTATLATSTIFGNLRIAGNASTSNLFVSTLASTTSLIVTSVPNSLVLTASGGLAGAYGGSSCTSGQLISALSATGAATCAGYSAYDWTPTTSFATAANSTTTLLLLTNGLSASSTVRFGSAAVTHQFTWDGANGKLGIGSSTPWALVSINANVLPTGVPIFAIGSTSDSELVVAANGYAGFATTSPWSRLTLGFNYLASGFASSSITVQEYRISTTTNKTIDARDGNQQLFQIGGSATTITLTGFLPGSQLKLIVCNPNATAGTITWATSPANVLQWSTGVAAPTQVTTANKCSVMSFIGTTATSTQTAAPIPANFGSLGKIFGTQLNF